MRWFLRKLIPTVAVLGVYGFLAFIWQSWWIPFVVAAIATAGIVGFYTLVITLYWTYDYKGRMSLGKYIKKEVFNR